MTSGDTYLARESPELVLPLTLFSRYLQFLARRPISESNLHYRATRVAGLRSLIPVLAAAPQAEIVRVSEQLRTLTPANLVRLAPKIHRGLRGFREPALPREYRSIDASPDAEFYSGAKRVLVLIGPAIGIGDEIIMFPLPRALHSTLPGAHITVASAYPQVWDRVDGVDDVQQYADLHSLLKAIRSGGSDLLFLVDFENPALAAAISHEAGVSRYVELALGPRQLLALDRRRLLQWRMPVAEPEFQNYYDCVQGMCDWLGATRGVSTEQLMPVTPRPAPREAQELVVFVNPFTSKEDPSERYWAELLCSVWPAAPGTPVRMLINTGPSLTTRSLALGLARKVEAHYAGRALRVEVPYQPNKPGSILGIGDIFRLSDAADVIFTADSFPAHAAQLFRRLTMVLGKPRTEPWRSPSEHSFYFSSIEPLSAVAQGIRTLLAALIQQDSELPAWSEAADSLRSTMAALEGLLTSDRLEEQSAETVLQCWASLRQLQPAFLEQLLVAEPGYEAVFRDSVYSELLPSLGGVQSSALANNAEAAGHLRRRLAEWKNSNLPKYVLQLGRTGAPLQRIVP